MSMDDLDQQSFSDIKARFEAAGPPGGLSSSKVESKVQNTRRLFEKSKNALNSSIRPPIKPKPKYLLQKKFDDPPPVPKHASRSVLSSLSPTRFDFSQAAIYSDETLRPSSSNMSSEDNRDSGMSDDVLPATPADSSSADESTDDDEREPPPLRCVTKGQSDVLPSDKAATLHTSVIDQMKKEGLFLQLRKINNIQDNNGTMAATHSAHVNVDTAMDGDDLPSPDDDTKNVVMRDSPDIPDHLYQRYADVDSEDKKAYIYIERVIGEITLKEEYFTRVLSIMVRQFPCYISRCEEYVGHPEYPEFAKVVNTIVVELEPVLQSHEKLLEDFYQFAKQWDSRRPNLASLMLRHVDFLRLCCPFLAKKDEICKKFTEMLKIEAFQIATQRFEDQVLNAPELVENSLFSRLLYPPESSSIRSSNGLSYTLQLDMVNQNVFRYSLIMDRYYKALLNLPGDNEEELERTRQVQNRLDNVLASINTKVVEKESLQYLLHIQRDLQKLKFEVIAPGRQFIRQGNIIRQTRKDEAERVILLFTDCLLICHCDFSKLWKVEIQNVVIEADNDPERDCWFILRSYKKSMEIRCKNNDERKLWIKEIQRAADFARANSRDEVNLDFAALWISDDKASMCMMLGCCRRFNTVNRRHHCRKCGYIICGMCSAEMPVYKDNVWKVTRACAVCYYEAQDLIKAGELAWYNDYLAVKNGKQRQAKNCFTPPRGGRKSKATHYYDPEFNMMQGRVFFGNAQKYARLSEDFILQIFNAKFDPVAVEQYYLKEANLTSNDLANRKISLQFTQKDSDQVIVSFCAPDSSRNAWKTTFKNN